MSLENAVAAHMNVGTDGSIFVRNDAMYVARFSITYKVNGVSFSQNSPDITIGVNKQLFFPEGATQIDLKVEEMWGFGWSTIFTKEFPKPVTQCYKLSGTTLNPGYEEIEC